MIARTQATDNANTEQPTDKRRITENDADYQRLHAHFERLLRASLKLLLKELRAGDGAATARFIHRHTDLLRSAYVAAHAEGQRDYWHGVTHNLRRKHVVTPLVPDDQQVQRQLAFYALASVTKMAHEVQTHVRTTQTALSATTARLSGTLEHAIQLDDAAKHTGVMVAFLLKPATAKKLAIPNGEPAEDLHLTLTFHGDLADKSDDDVLTLCAALSKFAEKVKPLDGTVSGIGRFNPSASSDGKSPIIALVNIPGLQAFRQQLADCLKTADWGPDTTFAYTPHITLAYVDADAETPIKQVPAVTLDLDTLTLACGDTHYHFPLGKKQPMTFADGDAPLSDSDFLASMDNRVQLQGQIVWPGMQDGYVAAGANDSANPYSELWWNLEPVRTKHCGDCPQVAFGSPYDPPGSGGNELNQTPGDGRTECGAACKCDLSYSFPAEGSPALDQLAQAIVDQWNSWTAAGAPPDAQPPQTFAPPAQTAQGDSTLSTQQISTMDAFRAAWDRWEAVRGDLPPAPTMFGTEWNGPDLPPWDSLTPEQQQVIADMQQALLDWMDDASNAFGFQPADSGIEEDSGQ